MTILRTDTVSGIGTEGTVLEGNITIDSLNYMTLPKGTTDQRYSLEGRDPDYHKLKLHLPLVHHTQFDDYSPASPSITANYDSHISSKSGVFEHSAALFSRQGSNDWLYYSDSTDNDLGSDDFTIECWFMCTDGGTNGYLVQKGTTSGNWSYFIQFREATDSINFYGTSDGTNFDIVNGTSFGSPILPNRWYHVAVCRSGNTFSYYINGQKGATTDTSSASFHNSNVDVRIPESGGFGSTEEVFLQDFRFYKGVAKYSESFTPQKLAEVGAIRYNTDSNKIECYNGMKWMNIAVSSPDLGGNGGPSGNPTGNSADKSSGARGFAIGGNVTPGGVNDKIDYINIASAGNAVDFGNMVSALFASAGMSSRTRAVISGGRQTPSNTSDIQYLTMASTGDTVDWGVNPLNSLSYGSGAVSNQTRGVTMGGYNTSNSTLTDIQFLTIASLGTINDFGDISAARGYISSVNSPTRGLCNGGSEPAQVNTIEFITIASTGHAQDFGDLSVYGFRTGGCMSSTRGLIAFGQTPAGDNKKNIDYVTIASTGNGANFGDLSVSGQHPTGTSDCVRGVWLGRQNGSPYTDNEVIDYNTIATQGDAIDFGNLNAPTSMPATASTGHGGL